MTSKPVSGIVWKNGKLVRKRPYRSKIKAHKADREAKAWAAAGKKNPRPKPGANSC